jgi:hypothetical protein
VALRRFHCSLWAKRRPDASGCRAAALMSDVYEDHKDEDGFLYITYSGENTFGC